MKHFVTSDAGPLEIGAGRVARSAVLDVLTIPGGVLFFATASIWSAFPQRPLLVTIKFLFRCLMLPRVTRELFNAIQNNPSLARFVLHKPRILLKLQRPYLNRGYTAQARLSSMLAHYEAVACSFTSQLIDRLISKEGICLAAITHGAAAYAVRLMSTDTFDREGELLLALEGETGAVACIAFSITNSGRQNQFEVGCLQGPRRNDGQTLVKRATKCFEGIRPKNLLIDALYEVARAWNIGRIVAVGNSNRIFGGVNSNCSMVFADYDAFWRELKATPIENGLYLLPSKQHHRLPADAPSHKRAEYRRRQIVGPCSPNRSAGICLRWRRFHHTSRAAHVSFLKTVCAMYLLAVRLFKRLVPSTA